MVEQTFCQQNKN